MPRFLLPSGNQVALAAGTKVGPYEILALIGKGGMGEVYRAHDTRLNRDVAVKFSAERFTERFEREAQSIAALNHSNICHLYDVGPNHLVMELVEGPTLAERIRQGAIPLEEALTIARQIADALEAAHEKEITHRDLKPGNIKVRTDGTVKVLDFGLAKMGGTPAVQTDNSPTVVNSQTEAGLILGTAAYMSPEQAKGKPVDQRADIYAFGLVLYEMLTGHRLHQGDTTTEILASVIKDEPKWDRVPRQVQKLLRKCLEKDPQKRLRHIGDVMELVDDAPVVLASTPATAVRVHPTWVWGGAGLIVLVVVVVAAFSFLRPVAEQTMLQMEIIPPEGVKFVSTISPFALSPDGRRVAFLGTGKDGKRMLWVRPIDSSTAVVVAGTENAEVPFWSPDSRWIGFSANGKLQKVDVVGRGQPQVICDIEGRAGGTWNSDGVIVFDQGDKPLLRVTASGGTPTPILKLDAARQETYHGAPYFLPDGRHLLYYSAGAKGYDIMLASLDGKLNRMLIKGAAAAIYGPNGRSSGSILYNARGQLLAQPFDLNRLELTGDPAVIADGVGIQRWWYASSNGLLAFRHSYGTQYQLTWVSREGRMLSTAGEPGLLSTPRISPDQKMIAVQRTSDQNADIWLFDITRNTPARFTFEPARDWSPLWSAGGKNIVYGSVRGDGNFIVERPANGVGKETVVAGPTGNILGPTAISPDDRWLIFTETSALHSIITMRARDDSSKVVHVQDRQVERDGSISPDGRWLLYSSAPAARREVLVQSVPKEAGGSTNAVGKWQISTGGGSQPAWRADGKEIFFVAPDGMMMAVPVESGENFFRPGTPKPLFQTRLAFDLDAVLAARDYDVTPDGQRFLLNQHAADSTDAPITVVVNWLKLLAK
jgi:Tol biopolymer transport system component/predicted Ser/Thr protein kinase